MEESLNLAESICSAFGCEKKDIRTYSGPDLAYIGDTVFDMVIRTVLVERGNRSVNELNRMAVTYVQASSQANLIDALLPYLTSEELDIYRRGRNSRTNTCAKNSSLYDYHKATGLEALLGYLYLTDRMERVLELVRKGLELINMEI